MNSEIKYYWLFKPLIKLKSMKKIIGVIIIVAALAFISCDRDECPVCHECEPCLCTD